LKGLVQQIRFQVLEIKQGKERRKHGEGGIGSEKERGRTGGGVTDGRLEELKDEYTTDET
jgi:hypothetical protein